MSAHRQSLLGVRGQGRGNRFDMDTIQKIPPVWCARWCFGVSDELLASPPWAIRVSGLRRSIEKINTAMSVLTEKKYTVPQHSL